MTPLRFLLTATLIVSGCGTGDQDYYPLQPGLSWEYALKITTFDGVSELKQVVRNMQKASATDNEVYVQEQSGGKLAYYRITLKGIERLSTRSPGEEGYQKDEPGHYLLPKPFVTGAHWSLPSHLSLIQSRSYEPANRITPGTTKLLLQYEIVSLDEVVDVPAGHFIHCLKTRATGEVTIRVDRGNHFADVEVESYDWYAPGVGLVKSSRIERSDSHYLQAGEYLLELEHMR